jgi:phospholipase C
VKFPVIPLVCLLGSAAALGQFPPQIKNVIVIFQENRTPDNLFHFLKPQCPIPANATGLAACTPSPVTSSCYNISPCGLSNQHGKPVPVVLKPMAITDIFDPGHSHLSFKQMCDPDHITFACRNDGAWGNGGIDTKGPYTYVENPGVVNSDGSNGHFLDPYLKLAEQYGWANYMFQTNQGPSYPAHQYMFSGTSALTAEDDANSTFFAENFSGGEGDNGSGCLALPGSSGEIISPAMSTPPLGCEIYANGTVQECAMFNTDAIYPTQPVGTFCFQHQSIADLLNPRSITWKYYVPTAGYIWTAPDSIKSICEPAWVNPNGDPNSQLECTGSQWNAHVDMTNHGTDILPDIAKCNLAGVSWVIPDGVWSDHPAAGSIYGPSWIAAVVNAIGNNPQCPTGTPDAGQTYWDNTAIVITWDDWGGWSDHEPPPFLSALPCKSKNCHGDYQFGFRVPMIVVSAYTPVGYINNTVHDFGSVLRLIEGINHIPEGALGFADKRAVNDLSGFFSLRKPRSFVTIPAQKKAKFFNEYSGPVMAPDND